MKLWFAVRKNLCLRLTGKERRGGEYEGEID